MMNFEETIGHACLDASFLEALKEQGCAAVTDRPGTVINDERMELFDRFMDQDAGPLIAALKKAGKQVKAFCPSGNC